MSEIKFSPEEKQQIAQKVKLYFREELDQEIGGFEAEFLIDFFATQIGSYFYNRGVYDAQALMALKVDEISGSIFDLEKSTDYQK